jgi:hypothetical protein
MANVLTFYTVFYESKVRLRKSAAYKNSEDCVGSDFSSLVELDIQQLEGLIVKSHCVFTRATLKKNKPIVIMSAICCEGLTDGGTFVV